jgi:hypothetical protein
MRRYLIICAVVLAGCGPKVIPADLLAPCPGWTGRRPETEGEIIRAALAEKGGRECANSKLASIAALQ